MFTEDIILSVMGMFSVVGGVVIAIAALKNRSKRAELEHAERMLAIEKGVPLPPEALPANKPRNPYIWGFILITFGLALTLMLQIEGDEDWGAGLLFMLPGIGIFLASWLFRRDRKVKEGANSAYPPGSSNLG